MSNASFVDAMSELTTVPMDHVCHRTMKDAMAQVHFQLSTEHVVLFQEKKDRLTSKKLISNN
jgi:hypothetical protein